MLQREKILNLFHKLNVRLQKSGVKGELGMVGGAVMAVVYKTRTSTKDIDAIFEPASEIRKAAEIIAKEESIPRHWLNDAVKGFLVPGFEKEIILELSHLTVWAPEPRYLLAMKCLSARWDTSDKEDVVYLIHHLNLKKSKDVFEIIESFYRKEQIPAKTQFFIEEIFEKGFYEHPS